MAAMGAQTRRAARDALGFDALAALDHLSSRDARLARLIARVGPLDIRLDPTQSAFEALARSIVHQQLAGKAAATIHGRLRALHTMTDDAIVERLVQVRGIGRWTVEMLLIFRLGRGDVLPVNDYGVRHGFQLAYGKRALPKPDELTLHAEKWRPFRTAASWYMWRAVDLERGV